ncbi:MAG TPA: TenA family transcriptional regulator [Dehalococcoidia bacterium]|nr:TenA family transcriptional regulator [Dehalococcoidia bacterium]
MLSTQALLNQQAPLWQQATRHPFLDGVRDGSLPAAALDRWLVQDERFVDALLRFQAALLPRAPRPDQLVIAQGLLALAEELHWFEGIARERGLQLGAPLLPACREYIAYLDELTAEPGASYPTLITALWTAERAYFDAWQGARPGAPAFRAFVEHWTVAAFAEYVAGLAQAADRALAAAPEEQRGGAAAFRRVAALEQGFWQMAFAG